MTEKSSYDTYREDVVGPPRANMTCCISLREISEQRGPYDEQPATQGPNAFSQIFNSARRIARRP